MECLYADLASLRLGERDAFSVWTEETDLSPPSIETNTEKGMHGVAWSRRGTRLRPLMRLMLSCPCLVATVHIYAVTVRHLLSPSLRVS